MESSFPGDCVRLLQELVRIPSVNPEDHPGTERTGEEALAQQLALWLGAWEVEWRVEEVLPGRPNFLARFPTARPPRQRVALAPHLDTVGVGGMTVPPFAGELRDGKVWGRGASDTKGCLAAMLWALFLEKEGLRKKSTEVWLTAFMGEESRQPGSRDFAKRYPDFDFALVGEPTECQVVRRHLGCFWGAISFTGRAAHASEPSRGVNAILKAAEGALRLEREFGPSLARFADPVLGRPRLNVALIEGGKRPNIVPDRCELVIDLRTTPALHREGAERLLREWMESVGIDFERIEERTLAPPLAVEDSNPWVETLAGLGAELTHAPWFCDAAHLAEAGIPSVAAGPGSIAQAHTVDEFLAVEDLEAGVVFYRRFLQALD
ncbi:MAG: M20/M25/M40 family metallo-hydrolase [Verrucomicrobiota bacterium]